MPRGPGWIGLCPVVLDRVGVGRDSKSDRMTLGTKDMREAEDRRVRERSSVLRELERVAGEDGEDAMAGVRSWVGSSDSGLAAC